MASLTRPRVRTVSSNFGFSFGSSAPASSHTTPVPEEPPLKRRRTLLRNETTDVHIDAEAIGATKGTTVRAIAPSEGRRGPDLQAGVSGTARTRVEDVEDSFIAGLGNRKKKKRTPKATKITSSEDTLTGKDICRDVSTEVVAKKKPSASAKKQNKDSGAQDLPTSGRPKRRAAAQAAVKVTEGFEEEATSIDKKRQNTAPETRPRLIASNTAGVDDEREKPSTSGAVGKKSRSRTAAESKGKQASQLDAATDPGPATIVECDTAVGGVQQSDANRVPDDSGIASSTTARPKRATTQKRNAKATKAEFEPTPELVKEQLSKLDEDDDDDDDDDDPEEDTNKAATKSYRGATSKTARSTRKRSDQPKDTSRPPLCETDVNVTTSTTSPEKPSQNDQARRSRAKPPGSKVQDAPGRAEPTSKPSTRRKLPIKRDETRELDPVADVQTNPNKLGTSDHTAQRPPSTAVADENSTKPNSNANAIPQPHKPTFSTMKITKPSRNPRQKDAIPTKPSLYHPNLEHKTADIETSTNVDEDIDWLFAPSKQTQRVPVAVSTKAHRGGRKKMAEVDLDDLLTDIASMTRVGPSRRTEPADKEVATRPTQRR